MHFLHGGLVCYNFGRLTSYPPPLSSLVLGQTSRRLGELVAQDLAMPRFELRPSLLHLGGFLSNASYIFPSFLSALGERVCVAK